MNLTERVALKNRLVKESGLDAQEWQAKATMEARAAGLEFNDWLALGKNITVHASAVDSAAVFTDGGLRTQEESAVGPANEDNKDVTEDNKLSTQERTEETTEVSAETGGQPSAREQESSEPSEQEGPAVEPAAAESQEIVDQASPLRQVAAEAAAAAESVAETAEASELNAHGAAASDEPVSAKEEDRVEPEAASVEAGKEQGSPEASAPVTEKQNIDPTPKTEAVAEVNKAAEEVAATATMDRTLEVIGKEKGGPAIMEAADATVGSGDVATQALFSRVAAATSQVGEELEASGDTYAEFIENHVSKLCQQARVSNIDLSSFGIRAQSLNYQNLKILSYGKHKFLGLPLSAKQEEALVFRLGLYCQQSPKDKIVIQAVSEVKDSTGFTFYSLLFTDQVIQKLVNATNFTVYINANDPDVSKLVVVVEKCQPTKSILA